jgi:hypothetical protein
MTLTSDLERLHSFVFPGGEAAARRIRGLRDIQKGELRAAPGAPWTSFTAEETILATSSNFHWSARAGMFTVADAYDETGGHLVIKAGGLFPVKKLTGPEMDKGQLQRCLGLIACCPSILLNHATLSSEPVSPGTVRFRDTTDSTDAYIDFDIDADGCPVRCHAIRPRVEAKEMIPTPWSVVASEFREWEGMRLACKYEVAWQFPDGPFPYLRAELTTLTALP